jgi:hypothetical protein
MPLRDTAYRVDGPAALGEGAALLQNLIGKVGRLRLERLGDLLRQLHQEACTDATQAKL